MLKSGDTTLCLLGWLKLKRPTILGVGEDVKELEFTYIDGENIKWYNHFGKKDLDISLKS